MKVKNLMVFCCVTLLAGFMLNGCATQTGADELPDKYSLESAIYDSDDDKDADYESYLCEQFCESIMDSTDLTDVTAKLADGVLAISAVGTEKLDEEKQADLKSAALEFFAGRNVSDVEFIEDGISF